MGNLLRRRSILMAISILLGASCTIILLLIIVPSIPAASSVSDTEGDAYALPLFPNKPVPVARGYHDIVGAGVERIDGGLLLSIELADGLEHYGDGYEVVYIWSIEYMTASLQKREYKVVIPYFPEEQGLNVQGWYLAVFDASSNRWLVPMLKIDGARGNAIDIDLDARVIGSPVIFWWSVDVMVNVDTATHAQPDYLMDSIPDRGKGLFSPFSFR